MMNFDKIKNKNGFTAIYQNKIMYSIDSIISSEILNTTIDEFLNHLVESRIDFTSHSVSNDAVILIIGEHSHTKKEYGLLERLLMNSTLSLDINIISFLVGFSPEDKSHRRQSDGFTQKNPKISIQLNKTMINL